MCLSPEGQYQKRFLLFTLAQAQLCLECFSFAPFFLVTICFFFFFLNTAFYQLVQKERVLTSQFLSLVFQGHRGSELLADLQRTGTRGQNRRLRHGSRHLQVRGSRCPPPKTKLLIYKAVPRSLKSPHFQQ